MKENRNRLLYEEELEWIGREGRKLFVCRLYA